jgi:ketosteroid isomerase-like protein
VPPTDLDVVRRGFDAMNARDLATLVELVAEDMVAKVPTGFANADVYHGREGFMRMAEQWLEPWSEFRVEQLEVIEEGDAVVVAVRQSGTGRESGIEVDMELAYLLRVRDGRLAEWRLCADAAEALALARGNPVFDPDAPSG